MKTDIVIDWRHFTEADDGDTNHYGGSITVTVYEQWHWWTRVRYWWWNKTHPETSVWRCFAPSKKTYEFIVHGSDRSGMDTRGFEVPQSDEKAKVEFYLDDFLAQQMWDCWHSQVELTVTHRV